MNSKNVFGIAALIFATAFAVQTFQQHSVEAQASQQTQNAQSASAVEYAVLEVDGDNVTWKVSGNQIQRTESIKSAYRRLGGSNRGTFADLLDEIGSSGWELVQVQSSNWIFTRDESN